MNGRFDRSQVYIHRH